MTDYKWAEELSCGVTVCDLDANIIFQNSKARKIFESYGPLLGKNLKDCHNPKSWEMIQDLMSRGESNSYTIEKKGIKKLIHQTPWFENGKVMGLVEFSIELLGDLPHYIR